MRPTLPAVAALTLSTPASAAFVGWAAYTRTELGSSTVFVDVFATFDGAADRALNVFNGNIGASGATFLQAGSIGKKAWAPQAGQSAGERDSFMTVGGLLVGGEYYASSATGGDPSFTGTAGAWNPTILSTPSTTIPANAGWFASDPFGTDNVAVDLDAAVGGEWQSRTAQFGVWVAHFAFDAASVAPGATVTFNAKVGYKTGTGPGGSIVAADARTFMIPAPGAIALLGAAGLVGARVRMRG
jgi:hypothetical protein